jgi:hypothetical protein
MMKTRFYPEIEIAQIGYARVHAAFVLFCTDGTDKSLAFSLSNWVGLWQILQDRAGAVKTHSPKGTFSWSLVPRAPRDLQFRSGEFSGKMSSVNRRHSQP